VVLLLGLGPAVHAQQAPDPSKMDDAAYVAFLETADADSLDPRRLSRLFFGVAATLDGGRTSVRLLQNAIVLRDATQEHVRGTVRTMFGEYEASVARLGEAAAAFLDRPESVLRLHDTIVDGHEACWRLDAYARVTETYGARPGDLVSILASSEACARFRRAAFAPGARALVRRTMAGGDDGGARVERLERELAELEKLLEELRKIDEQP
jgi:hypothetical protein